MEVNIKDNVTIDTDNVYANAEPDNSGSSIGGGDIRVDSNRKVVVNIDGGTNGKVKIGDGVQIFGKYGAISATKVNIGNNVLLKMKPWESPDDKYINVNGAEAAVGTRNNPAAGGLVNTIGDNTELWYTDYNGVLQKIVHSKNLCTKHETDHKDANCTENGWVKYECTFESNKGALHPEHKDPWTENTAIDPNAHDYQNDWTVTTPATGHHWKDNGDGTHTCPDCGATEGQPVNTNSALELRVVDAEGMDQLYREPERHPAHLHRCLRYRHSYRRPGHPALPAGAWRTDHPVRHQWPDQQLCHQRPAGTGQRQRGVLPHPPWGRRAHPAAGGGRPQRSGERLTIPGGGVYRKAPLASLLQKPRHVPHRAGGFFGYRDDAFPHL